MSIAVEQDRLLIAEAPPRDYFTHDDFEQAAAALPHLKLEWSAGQITVNPVCGREWFTIEEFIVIADTLADYRLELIEGELVMNPKPDDRHQKQARRLNTLFGRHTAEIERLGCEPDGGSAYYEIPLALQRKLRNKSGGGPTDVCADVSICYRDYLDTGRIPPALLIVEVLSVSNSNNLKRDLEIKLRVYAALEVPAYWIVDRRDESVLVYTEPRAGKYTVAGRFHGSQLLPAPGLEFLQITPAQIFTV